MRLISLCVVAALSIPGHGYGMYTKVESSSTADFNVIGIRPHEGDKRLRVLEIEACGYLFSFTFDAKEFRTEESKRKLAEYAFDQVMRECGNL